MFGHEPAVPNLAEVSQPTRASRDFLRVFKELKQAVVQSPVMGALGGAVGAAPQSAPSLEDDAFLTHKVRVNENCFRETHRERERDRRKERDMAGLLGGVSLKAGHANRVFSLQ